MSKGRHRWGGGSVCQWFRAQGPHKANAGQVGPNEVQMLHPQSLLAGKTGPGQQLGPVVERGRPWCLSLILHQSSRDRWLRSGLCRWCQAILQEMTKLQTQGILCHGHHVPSILEGLVDFSGSTTESIAAQQPCQTRGPPQVRPIPHAFALWPH